MKLSDAEYKGLEMLATAGEHPDPTNVTGKWGALIGRGLVAKKLIGDAAVLQLTPVGRAALTAERLRRAQEI